MIRNGPFLAVALLAAAPAVAAERSYPVTDFDRVQVEGGYEVTLVTGRNSSARAEGSQAALDRVTVEVQGGILHIRPNRSAWGGSSGGNPGPVRIALSTRDLRTATVIGAGILRIDRVRGLRADLSLSGSGRIEAARVEADNLTLGAIGAGRIVAAGTARQLKVSVQGAAELAAPGLVADDLVVSAETTGDIALAARRTAKVRSGGAGRIAISGTPDCTVTNLGAGTVRCGR